MGRRRWTQAEGGGGGDMWRGVEADSCKGRLNVRQDQSAGPQ